MPSTLTWLDHSDRDRQQMLDALEQFKERDTRDELGIASIRDVLADTLFPGTSTLQTRARYFFFIPWLYRALEEKRIPASGVAHELRKLEIELSHALLTSEDTDGAFGKRAAESLKRLPSSVYWQGLSAWQIRRQLGSQSQYHQSFGARSLEIMRDDDGEIVGGRKLRAWDSHLPEPPTSFPKTASFTLTRKEAKYLGERIKSSSPDSFLSYLLERDVSIDVPYPWDYPQLSALSRTLRDQLNHARLFAEAMQGAAYLYNLMLAEELRTHGIGTQAQHEWIDEYGALCEQWCTELSAREEALQNWDRSSLWGLVEATSHPRSSKAKPFVETWIALNPWKSVHRLTSDTCRTLIREREHTLKLSRARLGNPRALEMWGGDAGTARMNFRWPVAVRLLRDIDAGLERVE